MWLKSRPSSRSAISRRLMGTKQFIGFYGREKKSSRSPLLSSAKIVPSIII